MASLLKRRGGLQTTQRYFTHSGQLLAGVKNTSKEWSQYERISPIDHVLLRPGMYIGSTMWSKDDHWVYDGVSNTMKKIKVSLCPALLKVYDEILVNAADNFHRQQGEATTKIDIIAKVSADQGLVLSVKNDGRGIPIVKHGDEQMYVPELIFGQLLTGSNFDDSAQRLTGGSHGYGAKLTNIFSRQFSVDICDVDRKVQYHQSWSSNMKELSQPLITVMQSKEMQKSSSSTTISFEPDLKRFHLENILENREEAEKVQNLLKLFERRAFDVAACLNGKVKVSFNGEVVPIHAFEDYCQLFDGSSSINVIHIADRWQVALLPSPTKSFETMSFVNAVWTGKGGSHVNVILNQIIQEIESILAKSKMSPSTQLIKNNLMLLVNCRIPNPSFEGQTKDSLLTSPSQFASNYTIPKKQLKEMIERSGVIDRIIADFKALEQSRLESLTSASKITKRKMLLDVPKLEDAHYAGTDKALECTLILTEGDSAKALAVSGLSVVGRDYYGVMPLRGKLLNVKSASKHQISHNEEISHLCKALGLEFSKSYAQGISSIDETNTVKHPLLRYGKIMLMCDQDTDGSHIKGLILNFLHHFWPNLLKKHCVPDGFVQVFVTPIVKVRDSKGKVIQSFFNIYEYHQWLEENGFDNASGTIGVVSSSTSSSSSSTTLHRMKIFAKYYKGLGTSTAEEGKEYFSNIDRHKKIFVSSITTDNTIVNSSRSIDDEAIDLLFSKDRSRERKEWLSQSYSPSLQLNLSSSTSINDLITYKDFIEKELIHFSFSDNWRSIPSVIDGLKPSQRKVLFGCFHRFQSASSSSSESKLVQLAGYIAEKSAYHHGEASLHSTLVNMAQSFVGSNNIPIIQGIGQFGTRFKGGQDHASPRYIFAKLSPLARKIFPRDDDNQLHYLEEDGIMVEPKWYLPIIPYLLINGSQGIGTGWSTKIPAYNPLDLIDCIEEKLMTGSIKKKLIPWYQGFKGSIQSAINGRKSGNDASTILKASSYHDFISTGIAKRINKTTIEITELPIEKWTEDYKEFLHRLVESGDIKGFKEFHGTEDVRFVISAPKATLDKMEVDGLIHSFKLTSSINLSNMHAFSKDDRIKRYSSPEDIVEDYFPIRLEAYDRRKEAMMKKLNQDAMISENRCKFVEEIVSGNLDLYGISSTSNEAIAAEMYRRGYLPWSTIHEGLIDSDNSSYGHHDFSYLLNMPLHSLSMGQVQALQKVKDETFKKLGTLKSTNSATLWTADLDSLRKAYLKLLRDHDC